MSDMKKTTHLGDADTQGTYVALGPQRTSAAWRYSGKASKGGLQLGGLIFLLGALLGLSCGAAQADEAPVKGAYWPTSFHTVFPAKSIPSNLYTHLFFAFVGFNNSTFQVTPESPEVAELLASFSATVKVANPLVKTLISIGGGDYGAKGFANMTSSPAYRSAFIKSSIAVARKHGFDGLDLDYEFPDSDEDMALLSTFLDEWRAGVTAEAQETSRTPLLLTAAVYYAPYRTFQSNASYPIPSITKNLDFVNLMLYDLHGSWEKKHTNYNAPLFANDTLSGSYGVQTWLKAGLPPSKAVFGIPSYGYSWILADKSIYAVGAAATGVTPAQNVSGQAGLFFYSEVAEFIKQEGVVSVYDKERVSSYAHDATGVWVGYDSPEAVTAKVQYSKQFKLRGYFFWAVSYDDTESSLGQAASRALDLPPYSDAPAEAPSSGASSQQGSSTAGFLWATGILLLSKGIGAI